MKKSDLKTGMTVVTRKGNFYKVLENVETFNYGFQKLFFAGERGFTTGDSYSENLLCNSTDDFDIVTVFAKASDFLILNLENRGKVLWERKKDDHSGDVTLKQIAEIFGIPLEKLRIVSK